MPANLIKLLWGTVRVIGSEAGLKWGLVHNHKAKGMGVWGASLRFPAFWLLGGHRCAALALLQTHSATASSERCNSK